MMTTDEIDEIRAVRTALAARCGNDLDALAELIRQRQDAAMAKGRKIIDAPEEQMAEPSQVVQDASDPASPGPEEP